MASKDIPRSFLAPSRSAFSVIDPITEYYYRVLDLSGAASLGSPRRAGHYFAISYVWSEWKDSAEDKLPSWPKIRERLLHLSTTGLVTAYNRAPIGFAGDLQFDFLRSDTFRCWLDSKCIDQASLADKSYWIPRMNEVYFDAQCTILLLKDLDLTVLYELYKITTCLMSKNLVGVGLMDGSNSAESHRCLFTPNCISLKSILPSGLEDACLTTLEALWFGSWRKRAWIFQEILLSERYILSWGDSVSVAYMDLGTVGCIAAFLHQRHPLKAWLKDFWTWCKQCQSLREFYADKGDMEATILQLAQELESTVPCDKYYALCGILGLTEVGYDISHTAEMALTNIISALTKQGRLGWMYSIPSTVGGSGITISDQNMSPFILTRKKRQAPISVVRESFATGQLIGLNATEIGTIIEVQPFKRKLLDMAFDFGQTIMDEAIDDQSFHFLFLTANRWEHYLPSILFRLGYDIINPLRENVLFRLLCKALKITKKLVDNDAECLWMIIVKLCFLDTRTFTCDTPLWGQLVNTAALSIQNLCQTLISQKWSIMWWHKNLEGGASETIPQLALVQNYDYQSSGERRLWSVQSQRSYDTITFVAEFENEDSILNDSSATTHFSQLNSSFYSIAFQIPQSLLSVHTMALYHEQPPEADKDVMQQLIQNVKSKISIVSKTLDIVSKTMDGEWKKKIKFILFPRHQAALPTRYQVANDLLRTDAARVPLFSSWNSRNPRDVSPPPTYGSDEKVESLLLMFPSIERDVLSDVLQAHNRRIQPAIEQCLEMFSETTSSTGIYELPGSSQSAQHNTIASSPLSETTLQAGILELPESSEIIQQNNITPSSSSDSPYLEEENPRRSSKATIDTERISKKG